jgi:small subunit ribosomal protein S17
MAKSVTGVVVSDKVDKTIVVLVQSSKNHPLYRKRYTVSKRFMAHDEQNQAKVGDKVRITETRPISKNKHFKLEEITSKAVISEENRLENIASPTEEEKK